MTAGNADKTERLPNWQLDIRRILVFLIHFLEFIPFIALWLLAACFIYPGKWLGSLCDLISAGNKRLYKWANPDVFGRHPKRTRRLFYSRRTVNRLADRNESLGRMVTRMSSDLDSAQQELRELKAARET